MFVNREGPKKLAPILEGSCAWYSWELFGEDHGYLIVMARDKKTIFENVAFDRFSCGYASELSHAIRECIGALGYGMKDAEPLKKPYCENTKVEEYLNIGSDEEDT